MNSNFETFFVCDGYQRSSQCGGGSRLIIDNMLAIHRQYARVFIAL